MLHGGTTSPVSDAKTEEVLRQALAVIAAHNETLTNAGRLESPRSEGGGGNWMLRTSHLLWTLFLTAMVFTLFNASQTANRALSAKLDELSRIVEASAGVDHSRLFAANALGDFPSSASDTVAPAVVAPAFDGGESDSLEDRYYDTVDVSSDTQLTTQAVEADTASSPGSNTLASDRTELQPIHNTHSLSHYVSDWLHDLLRMPVTIIRAFLSIFIGA
uniref:Transmembrane protein n=2 Tax=Kalmanozyma brasiliensis (strain GHG001) TaxID=1365824 RepID=V5GGZ9_KALBG